MRRELWWHVVIALCARSLAQGTPTVCQDESCHCDSFTRVICNCTRDYDEVTLRPDGPYQVPVMATGIIIDGCARVYFLEDTVKELLHLRNIELRNVRHVYIKERALAWSPYPREYELGNPGLRISIHNSTVNEISSHAIKGRVDEISVTNSRINVIRPFAFSSLTGVKHIDLIDNVFDSIEIQAFKKFTTMNFALRGGTIRSLPSRFLSDVEVTNLFRMDGVNVKHVSSLAFLVTAPKRVLIERNIIGVLEGDAFHIKTRGPVTFRSNSIETIHRGAFLGISADREITSVMGLQEIIIDNSTATDLTPAGLSINRTTSTLRIDGLYLKESCSCELADQWKDLVAEQGGTIWCWYNLEGHYVTLPTYIDSRCGSFKQNFWIFIVVGVGLALLLGIIVAVLIVRCENEKKKKLAIVMPDGKTYRETEFHIVVERAELLTTDL